MPLRPQLSLAKVCLNGNPLGLEGKACVEQVAQFFSSSPHTPRPRAAETLRRGIKDTMRWVTGGIKDTMRRVTGASRTP